MIKKTYNVAIYLRLSDEDNNKQNVYDISEAIKNQRQLLIMEINKHDDYILFDEYCDENLSGAGTYRPEFERLINDCKSGKIDIVLCKSQSRFSRDIEIIEKYLHNKFIEWGVRFIGIVDNTDTNNDTNKKSRQINALVNEWYLEDVSNNIRSAFIAKMHKGEFISPFAAFGYDIDKNDNNKLIPDLVAANIVKKIFNLYIKGYGLTGIKNYLNSNEIPSPSYYKYQKGCKLNVTSMKARENIKWNINTIKTILTNELYIGNLIQGKRTTISYKNHKIINKKKIEWIRFNNTHEPIIDNKLFKKVQENIQKRTRTMNKRKIVHNYSGKVFCLSCGSYMRKKNTNTHEYLVCTNTNCINKYSIRYDLLDNIILNKINDLLDKYNDKKLINKYLNMITLSNNSLSLIKEKLHYIDLCIQKNNAYLLNIYDDKINGNINNEQFNYLSNIYEKRKKIYSNEKSDIENKLSKINNNKNLYIFKKYAYLNRIIVDEFIDAIYISTSNKIIKIKWNL